jgi:ubiquinone/menaquinone biosynthesis C-methylase UbiE
VESIIEEQIDEGAKVLDVGCGSGESTLRFARRAERTVGVDYVPTYVERAH